MCSTQHKFSGKLCGTLWLFPSILLHRFNFEINDGRALELRHSIAFLIFIISVLCACDPSQKSGKKFLLPWPDSDGIERLQVVEIHSLNSPYEVSGPAAQVYLDASVQNGGFTGDPVHPKVSLAGGVFHPLDTSSSMALALYAHIERIEKLDRELGVHSQVGWPRQVGLNTPLLTGRHSQTVERNNARYFPDWDLVAFLPVAGSIQPLALNPGVIAHEHFHSIFNSLFLSHHNQDYSDSRIQKFNWDIVVRGWNEGLADYFAALYTKNPNFLEPSFGVSENAKRSLDRGQIKVRRSQRFYDIYRSLNPESSPYYMSYRMGTDIAKTLFALVESENNVAPVGTHFKMMMHILKRLPKISQKLEVSQNQLLNSEFLMTQIFQAESEFILTKTQCGLLVMALGKNSLSQEFTKRVCP